MPHSRNGRQSAATLLAVDYGPYTFLASGPSAERMGRDYGVQLRGYPETALEYRLALTQGIRGTEARNPLRVSGRVVYYPFGAETGFFYGGTFQGTKNRPASAAASTRRRTSGSTPPTGSSSCRPSTRPRDSPCRSTGSVQRRSDDSCAAQAEYVVARGRLPPLQPPADAVRAVPGARLRGRRDARPVALAGGSRLVDEGAPAQSISVGRLTVAGGPTRTQVLAQLQIFYF